MITYHKNSKKLQMALWRVLDLYKYTAFSEVKLPTISPLKVSKLRVNEKCNPTGCVGLLSLAEKQGFV